MKVYIAGVHKNSIVDGPGLRYVIFFQGCNHKCKGCHNPKTHKYNTGKHIEIDQIIRDIISTGVKGVTISGGEPFDQSKELYYLVKSLKELNYNIWIYSGYIFEELQKDKYTNMKILRNIDTLVDGPFVEEKFSKDLLFKGSKNQRIINVRDSLLAGKTIESSI